MVKQLPAVCIPHAAWIARENTNPSDDLLGLAAVRYYRFPYRARVDRFRLHPVIIRSVPHAYGRPDHVVISRFVGNGWETAADLNLPVIEKDAWHEVELGGVETDHLRVVCDREHPARELSHNDCAYATWNVPFEILDRAAWWGEPLEEPREPPYEPPLAAGLLRPTAPDGMKLVQTAYEVRFNSPYFSVAFSLSRPMITHLAWDVTGTGLVNRSLTCLDSRLDRRRKYAPKWPTDLISGPWLSGLQQEAPCLFWTGEVSVDANRVIYRNLHLIDGLSLNVQFDVFAEGMDIRIHQSVRRDLHVPEYEPWRFLWNAEEAITGTLAAPVGVGRGGLVTLPAMWAAPGHGTVLIRQTGGDPTLLQVDSVRRQHFGMSGIVLGADHDEYGLMTIRKGEYHTALSLRAHLLLPRLAEAVTAKDLPTGLRRNWATAFTFRPEFGGFSNNAMSVICLMCEHEETDACAHTPQPEGGPSLLDMARYTIGLGMKGGPGYGEVREFFMDTDPSLLCSAGRIHQADPDHKWLETLAPWVKQTAVRILEKIDEQGLYLCEHLSGNSGSGRWGTNAMDVMGFGHYDAYSNALGYRALRNAVSLMRDLGDAALAGRCEDAAAGLKASYGPCFFNPRTGWLAGWKSRDGQLHDYAFTFINAMAICFDLIEGAEARGILERLEAKRGQVGYRDFHFGLPTNLIPVRNEDMPPDMRGGRADGMDMFGIYVNGCATTVFLEYTLGALAKYGFTQTADLICDHLDESLADNRIVGGMASGMEFFTWQGAPCGYEGVLQTQFRFMLAMAQYRGWVQRFDPEWWPG